MTLDTGGSAAASLLGTLAVAAIIGPEEVGLSTIALGIVQIVLFPFSALFAEPICQRKRLTSAQLDAAFWVLVALGLAVAGGLLATANLWGRVYGNPSVPAMLGVGSLTILSVACSSVQAALLRRHMRFRALAIMGLTSRSAAAAAAVALALAGFGAWSLLLQVVLAQAVFSVGCVAASGAASGWRPRARLPLRSLKGIIGFALMESAVQSAVATRHNLFPALLGLYLPLERLGEIGFAMRLTDALRSVIGTAAARLGLPLLARQQDAPDRLRDVFLDASRLIGVIALPGFTALAVCAPELIRTVFGERWLGAVPHFQVLSILSAVLLARLPASLVLTATARPKVALLVHLAALAAMLVMMPVVSPATAAAAMACWVLPHLVIVSEFWVVRGIFGISIRKQLAALVPGLAMAAVVGGVMIGLEALLAGAGLPSVAFLAIEAVASAVVLVLGLAAVLRGRLAPTRP